MKVAIITEGFNGTGYGHLTRCLSLYQAFEEKNIIPLYIANCDEDGKKFIGNVNLLQFDWLNNAEKLYNTINDYDIAIIDSYLAPLEIYEKIHKNVKKAVYFDDYLRLNYPPGVIVNGAIGAEKLPYKKDDRHMYLLGVEYIPLRKEFWDVKPIKKENKEISDVLITFGGQDIRNLTFQILELLLGNYTKLNYHVIIPSNNYTSRISEYPKNVCFYNSLTAKEMLSLMLKCDIAVTAAGQTTYELARIGLPTIAIGVVENQKFNIDGWLEIGFLSNKLWFSDINLAVNFKKEFDIFYNQKNKNRVIYCDGNGARRIVRKLVL